MTRYDPETMLTTIGRAAVEAARAGKEIAIQERLDHHTSELRRELAALIAANPDPARWTADHHALFIRATNPAIVCRPAAVAKQTSRAKSFDRPIDDEIPF